ncbi:hypothetical protein H0H81_002016, partial [Sphagnurus paluster]
MARITEIPDPRPIIKITSSGIVYNTAKPDLEKIQSLIDRMHPPALCHTRLLDPKPSVWKKNNEVWKFAEDLGAVPTIEKLKLVEKIMPEAGLSK